MGSSLGKKKKANSVNSINVSDEPKLVMQAIIHHWIRQHEIHMFSEDIANKIIIEKYLYQKSFEKDSRSEKYKPPKRITSTDYDYLFKLLLLGDIGVGKSSILLQLEEYSCVGGNSFLSTIGIDFKIKTIEFDGIRVKCQIWDTAGQERFRTITSAYYRGAHGIMLVYDITNKESIEHIPDWKSSVDEYAGIQTYENVLLIGNKTDLEKQRVTNEMNVSKIAQQCGIYQMTETSALKNDNVYEALVMICRQILNPKTHLQQKRCIHPFGD